MTPIEVYKTYLAFKNHFTKPNYDYFQYCGKSRASTESFNKRKDRYFFERMSRQKSDDEIRQYFLANFVECDDPSKLWIGEIIESGEKNYTNWLKRSQSLSYLFKTEAEVFLHKDSFDSYLQNAISIETFVIMDIILNFSKKFDKKLLDPVWESVSLRIKKYKSFLNIDKEKYTQTLKEIVL
jgi:hypothetical protein